MLPFPCLRTRQDNLFPGVITTCLLLSTCARLCRAEGNKTHSRERCGNSKIMPLKIFAAGVLNKRFVAFIQTHAGGDGAPATFCYFELPLNALQAKALYLSGGTPVDWNSSPKKWQSMIGLIMAMASMGIHYVGVIMADAQNRWIYFRGLDQKAQVTSLAFNLDTGALDKNAPHYPQGFQFISSPKKLEMYTMNLPYAKDGSFPVNDPGFRVRQLKGSKILLEATDVRTNGSFLICKSDSTHLNTKRHTEDATCSKNITLDWNDIALGSGGWSDGKRIYLIGKNYAVIFDASAFSSKLGQTVPYLKVKHSKFFIFARPPGGKGPSGPDGPDGPGDGSGKGGGHTALVLSILLVLLLIAAAAGYFFWYKPKQEKEKAANGEGAKGKSISGKRSRGKSLAGKRAAGGKSFTLTKRNSISRGSSSKSKKRKKSKKRSGASASKPSTKASSSKKVSIASKKLSRSRKGSSSRKLPGAFSSAKLSRSKKASVSRKFSASKPARTVRSKAVSSRKLSKSRKLG